MNRLSKLLLNQKDSSTSEIEEDHDQTNSMEVSISNIENSLLDWSIPKQKISNIYKIGSFDYFQGYSIKQTEKTLPLLQNNQNIQLFSQNVIRNHMRNYKFLHIGLVQIAIKPLTRIGLDVPTLVILRDARHLNFQNSLLAMAESNICNGPIYFNCYPNFTISLFDKNILDTLTLVIKTKNLEIKQGTDPIVVIYRVLYKTMTTTVEPRSKLISPKDETIIFEANTQNSRVNIPKRLKWNEITQNQNWKLEDITPPKSIDSFSKITNIMENTDGSIDINFGNKLEPARFSNYTSEASSSKGSEHLLRRSQSMRVKGVDFNRPIPKPLYEDDNISEDFSNSYNPTKSEVDYYREEQL